MKTATRLPITSENHDEPILTHIHFKASIDIDIGDIEAGYEQKTPLLKALNPPVRAKGLLRSFWGRVIENPEEVILCTSKPKFPLYSTMNETDAPQSGGLAKHSRTSRPHQLAPRYTLVYPRQAQRQAQSTSTLRNSKLKPFSRGEHPPQPSTSPNPSPMSKMTCFSVSQDSSTATDAAAVSVIFAQTALSLVKAGSTQTLSRLIVRMN